MIKSNKIKSLLIKYNSEKKEVVITIDDKKSKKFSLSEECPLLIDSEEKDFIFNSIKDFLDGLDSLKIMYITKDSYSFFASFASTIKGCNGFVSFRMGNRCGQYYLLGKGNDSIGVSVENARFSLEKLREDKGLVKIKPRLALVAYDEDRGSKICLENIYELSLGLKIDGFLEKAEEFVDTPDGLRKFFRELVALCGDGDEYAEVRKGDALDLLKAISDPLTGDEIASRVIANMTFGCSVIETIGLFQSILLDDSPDLRSGFRSGNQLNIMGRHLSPWMEKPEQFVDDVKKCILYKDESEGLSLYRSAFGDPTSEALSEKEKYEAESAQDKYSSAR